MRALDVGARVRPWPVAGWLICVTAEGAATRRARGQLAALTVPHVARLRITGLECFLPGRETHRCTGFFPECTSCDILIILAHLSLKV